MFGSFVWILKKFKTYPKTHLITLVISKTDQVINVRYDKIVKGVPACNVSSVVIFFKCNLFCFRDLRMLFKSSPPYSLSRARPSIRWQNSLKKRSPTESRPSSRCFLFEMEHIKFVCSSDKCLILNPENKTTEKFINGLKMQFQSKVSQSCHQQRRRIPLYIYPTPISCEVPWRSVWSIVKSKNCIRIVSPPSMGQRTLILWQTLILILPKVANIDKENSPEQDNSRKQLIQKYCQVYSKYKVHQRCTTVYFISATNHTLHENQSRCKIKETCFIWNLYIMPLYHFASP